MRRLVRVVMPAVLAVALMARPCRVEAQGDSAVVAPSAAAQYVGRDVTVRGMVAQVSRSRSGTIFLNFDKRYPNHPFSAVIFVADTAKFHSPEAWEGKTVELRGKVQMYQGKPEIILRSPAQVKLVGVT